MPRHAPTAVDAASEIDFRTYFAQVFEHDRAANGRVLETMTALGERRPRKPLDRMSHLIICQQLWLSRMGGGLETPDDIFPDWTLEEAKDRAEVIFGAMKHFIENLPEAAFHEHFRYTRMEGGERQVRRRDALTQLGQHGAYHRGQIAVELNPLLDEPLTTDYIFHVIEKIRG